MSALYEYALKCPKCGQIWQPLSFRPMPSIFFYGILYMWTVKTFKIPVFIFHKCPSCKKYSVYSRHSIIEITPAEKSKIISAGLIQETNWMIVFTLVIMALIASTIMLVANYFLS